MTYQDYAEKLEAFAETEQTRATTGAAGPAAATEKIGRVVSVAGSQVIALLGLEDTPAPVGSPGALQIGALVKMRTPETMVFGMVSGLSIPIPGQSPDEREMRIVELEMVGEEVLGAEDKGISFRRGVSFCPALGDDVYATNQEDLKHVYAQPDVSSAKIGTIYQDQSLPAFIAIDDLLGKHFAVLGTTGSGKSCAVATILRAILDQHSEGHVLLLDLHNEYSHAFSDCAEILGPATLKLPYWLLSFEELREILVERAENREADISILKAAVIHAKQDFNKTDDDGEEFMFSGDAPVPYRMSDVLRHIDESLGKLQKATDSAPYLRLRERINTLQADRRFRFMFEERLTIKDSMVDILSQLFRIPADGKPITILDLSAIPSDIMNVVISLVCRLTFDFALWAERDVPMLLVCEEAHRYASQGDNVGFETTKQSLSRIAKEGRKYGVSLCIVSQRPSELAVGILSQCNTIFALRMGNQKDHEFVRGTLSESALGLMDSLPSLRTGEAIGVGEGLSVPVRLCFDLLPEDQRPLSGTASFSSAWKKGDKDKDFVAQIVERWRHQRR
jgi:DNA helicase HerA-like ATPase